MKGMRLYLLVAQGKEERIIREEKVKSSVADVMKDSSSHKAILILELMPIISSELDKGKGLVFYFEMNSREQASRNKTEDRDLLLKDAIVSGRANSWKPWKAGALSEGGLTLVSPAEGVFFDVPTDYRIGCYEAGSSGKSVKKGKPKKRPHMRRRRVQGIENKERDGKSEQNQGKIEGSKNKRKHEEEVVEEEHLAKRHQSLAVSNEGLSNL